MWCGELGALGYGFSTFSNRQMTGPLSILHVPLIEVQINKRQPTSQSSLKAELRTSALI